MGWLNNQSLYTIIYCTVQSFCYIINSNIIPLLYMVNNDLAGKTSSYGKIRLCLFDGIFNSTNG